MIFHFKEIRNMFLGFILIREQGISLLLNGNLSFKGKMEFINKEQGKEGAIFEVREHVSPWEVLLSRDERGSDRGRKT